MTQPYMTNDEAQGSAECSNDEQLMPAIHRSVVIRRPLFRPVKNPAALLAADDFVPAFYLHSRCRRHFHVASGANAVLDRNDGCVALAGEQPFIAFHDILLDVLRQLVTFALKLLKLCFECLRFLFQIGQLPAN